MHALRAAEPDDAEALADLLLRTELHAYAEIFPSEAPKPTHAELLADWNDRLIRSNVFVATEAGEVVGVVAAGTFEGAGQLSRLYVTPERWGHGIGRALHDRCLADLELSGHGRATLWVLELNVRARSWYEGFGWTDTGRRKPVFGEVQDALYEVTLDNRSTASDFRPA